MTHKMNVYIPTLGREGRQYTLDSIPDEWKDRVYLVCPNSENHEWDNRIDVPSDCIGSISKTRQFILEHSPSPLVGQLDDDLTFYNRDGILKNRMVKQTNCNEFLNLMEKWLLEGDVFCGSSNKFLLHKNPSEYYYGKPSHCSFVNRDYLAKHNIRYDAITYFEDFHVPLSVLESGNRLRYSGEHITVERKANADGGCSISRTAETNRRAMLDLKELHKNYVELTEDPDAKNQNLVVGLKLKLLFAKAYRDNVIQGDTLEEFFA